MGCVQVYLTEEPKRLPPNTIFVATHCDQCQESSPSVPLSSDSKCLSLAKYLEMRFHCHAYRRRRINVDGPMPEATKSVNSSGENDEPEGCSHSLHKELVHSFSLNGVVANFQYSPIQTWEIRLPELVCGLLGERFCENTKGWQEEVKQLSQNGYEVFAKINDRLAQFSTEVENALITNLKASLTSDQLIFKSRVEVVHTLLTDKVVNLNEVNDAMNLAKRVLAESVEAWGPRLHEAAQQYKLMLKNQESQIVETPPHVEDDGELAEDRATVKYDSDDGVLDASASSVSSSKVPTKKSLEEKKTVKSIWNQLVSSSGNMTVVESPIPANEHHTLPLGMFPVTVDDQDLSSIVAHTLVSFEYRRALEILGSDATGSPHVKRKEKEGSVGGGDGEEEKEKERGEREEKERKNKSNCHATEIHCHDSATNITCKVLFAREFEAMRRICLRVSGDGGLRKASANSLSPKVLLEKVDSKGKLSLDSWKSSEAEEIRREFARSLSKSVPWDAKGGKSGSRFSKTMDKRFILKEMSKTDVGIFENFAPNYFEYVNESLKAEQLTLLAKIYGVFRVTVKKKDR